MKKIISTTMCLMVTICAFVFSLEIVSKALTGGEIMVGQPRYLSWKNTVEYYYLSLNVEETGFYSLNIEDNNKTGWIEIYIYEKDRENQGNDNLYDSGTMIYVDAKDGYNYDKLYLIKDRAYKIRCSYYTWDDEELDYVFQNANIGLKLDKSTYQPKNVNINADNNLKLGGASPVEWLYFKSSTAGDYTFDFNQSAAMLTYIFEKSSGDLLDYFLFTEQPTKRQIQLKSNTEYVFVVECFEPSATDFTLNIFKNSKNISEIEIIQNNQVILADFGYIIDDLAYFYEETESNLKFKVIYSDKTTKTMTRSELSEEGIDLYLTYDGELIELEEEYLFKTGNQPVLLEYMGRTSISSVYIMPYTEYNSKEGLPVYGDNDEICIKYEGDDIYTHYWRIVPSKTGVYDFRSGKWSALYLDSCTIFNKENEVIRKGTDGWCLIEGEEYCFRMVYYYKYGYSSDVNFWLSYEAEHTHYYTNDCDTKCEACGYTRTVNNHRYDNNCDTTCNTCGAERTVTHDYKAATCTNPKTCKVCGVTSGSKLGHTYTNKCDASCNRCSAKRRVPTHSYKTVVTKATTTEDGKSQQKCSVCGSVKSSKTIYKASSIKFKASTTTYNGSTKKPTVVVKDSKGNAISSSNYTVHYPKGMKNAGKYSVKVTFNGNYSGSKTLTYTINPIKSSTCSVKLSKTSYTYDGKTKSPSVTVKNAKGSTLKEKIHYTVKYASGRNNVGKYKVTVKFKGNYSGTKTLYFTINPAKTSIKKVTGASKSLKVSINKKATQVTGYQIQYSTSKKFTGAKTKTITSAKTTSATIKSLKAKKTYYVRVRTYKTASGKKYYSGWSSYKSAKTK